MKKVMIIKINFKKEKENFSHKINVRMKINKNNLKILRIQLIFMLINMIKKKKIIKLTLRIQLIFILISMIKKMKIS